MKKGGLIAGIIIIILFLILFFLIGAIYNELPKPKFGEIYNLSFSQSSTDQNTIILAQMNITNDDDYAINISYENMECDLYYNNQIIGSINLNDNNEAKFFTVIEASQTKRDFEVVFDILNDNISKIFYEHLIKNDEQGIIKFSFNFTFEIITPFGFSIPYGRYIPVEIETELRTDILEKLEWQKYNLTIDERRIIDYPRIGKPFITLEKQKETNIIAFRLHKLFRNGSNPLIDAYVGGELVLIPDSNPCNIRIRQEVMLYTKPLIYYVLNKFLLPAKYDLLANGQVIGNFSIRSIESNFIRSPSHRLDTKINIDGDQFGKSLNSHISNNETTFFNMTYNDTIPQFFLKYSRDINALFPSLGSSIHLFKFNSTISDIIKKIELPDITFDYVKIRQELSFYQTLTLLIVINTLIIEIILYFAFWRKEDYLIFKDSK